MESISKIFYLSGFIFLLMGLIFNIVPSLPRLPGDINIDRGGFKIYIPFVSAIILSVVLTILLNFFRK